MEGLESGLVKSGMDGQWEEAPENAGTMEETIWEQHTVTLNKAPGFGFGIAISGGKDNPHFQSGETSIVISDVLKGGPAEGMLHENDRVVTVNGKHMENVEHAFAVQQLRNSGKTAKITIKRKRRAQPPSSRHEPEAADEIFEAAKEDEEEEEEEEEDDFDRRSARSSRSERSGRSAARRGDRVSAAGGARERGHGHAGERAQSLGRREREASLGRVDRDYGVGRSEQDLTSGRSDRDRSAARTDRERSVGRTDREQGVVGRTERDPVLGRTDRDHVLAGTERDRSLGRVERDRGLGQNERERSLGRSEEDRNVMRSERSRGRSMSPGSSDRRSVGSYYQPKLVKVTLVKSKKSEEYGLRLGSQIFVKDVSAEGLAARDGNIHDGDIVLKINGTVTENMSLADARKLIERSKGKLRMVLQRDDQGTLITIPDLEDSIPSSNLSDRDDISEIQSLVSEPSDEAQSRQSSRSRSREDIRSPESETPSRSTGQPSTSSKSGSDPSSKTLSGGAVPTPFKKLEDGPFKGTAVAPQVVTGPEQPDGGGGSSTSTAPPAEPRPTFSRGGQPDVDLPVSPTPALPNSTLHMEMKLVKFRKGESVGLRLAGGNDVGIFVAGVQEGSPASTQGLEEGDQLLKVNNVDFQNIIREEAVLFLLELPKGEEVSILAQRKKDVYRRVVESDVGDSFYIRTHFGYEKETPYGLSFTRGEVFRVVDTLYNGKLGSWLAIRIGRNHQEVERGIIPNKNRAEQLANLQSFAKVAGGDRADFWRFRGLRSVKRNVRKSREDLATQPVQTKFPAYERVVLREAGFLRPVVIFGPIADVARERLARELPDQFEIAKSEPRDAGVDHKRHGMIRLYTIKQIIDRDKHALLDVTPNAVDRLNYAQWYPIVLFLGPDSKAGVKAMRQRLCPESNKSARKLYERSIKLRKSNSHLFTATIQLNYMNDGWYGSLKDTIRQQQNQLVWVSEGKADGSADDDLDMQDDRLSYLSAPGSEYSLFSADSRHASDYDDTDTEGGTYTDQEADEAQHVSAGRQQHQQQQQQPDAAMVRCSEPANPVLRLPEQQAAAMSRASSSEILGDSSPPPVYHPEPAPGTQSPRDAPARAHGSRNGPTSRSYGAGGAAPAPSAESHGGHGTLPAARPPPSAHYQRANDGEGGADGPKSKQAKSVMSRIKMFENLDNKARQERLLELQEAQQARVEIAQNFPDIYAVPNKGKQQDGQEQPQARRTAETQRVSGTRGEGFVPLPRPAHMDGEDVDSARRSVQQCKLPHPVSPTGQTSPTAPTTPSLPDTPKPTHNNKPTYSRYQHTQLEDALQSSYASHRTYAFPQAALPNSGNVPYQPPASAHAKPSQSNDSHYAPAAAAYGKVLAANGGACATTYAVTAAARHPATSNNNSSSGGSSSSNGGSSGNPTRAFAPPFAARFPSGGGYTGAARPFQRRFDSPKFSHNLLPEGAVRAGDGAAAAAVVGVSQAPSQHEFDSGTDTFPRHGDYRPKSHLDGLNATPKAIPVSPSALSEEEGHSVVATARGVFDSNGGVLSSVETGVSVVVPRGAIPEGLEQEIYFKVCQDNSIIPALDKEKGETLLSPLVMCGPHGLRFLKPVELRLPHCAAMNPDGWSFALKSSESITGDPRRWHNMALPGDPNYNVGANSVSVLIDHF
ncbi:unnamed protein product [Lampetra fluviatilis]